MANIGTPFMVVEAAEEGTALPDGAAQHERQGPGNSAPPYPST
ncbi:MAG: hypothetical protein ACLGJC_18470 [Alphaproteobacteria bacterium]